MEGPVYKVRFDMKLPTKDLLYMYGLRDAKYISENCKLGTFAL